MQRQEEQQYTRYGCRIRFIVFGSGVLGRCLHKYTVDATPRPFAVETFTNLEYSRIASWQCNYVRTTASPCATVEQERDKWKIADAPTMCEDRPYLGWYPLSSIIFLCSLWFFLRRSIKHCILLGPKMVKFSTKLYSRIRNRLIMISLTISFMSQTNSTFTMNYSVNFPSLIYINTEGTMEPQQQVLFIESRTNVFSPFLDVLSNDAIFKYRFALLEALSSIEFLIKIQSLRNHCHIVNYFFGQYLTLLLSNFIIVIFIRFLRFLLNLNNVPVVTRQWDTWYTAVIDGNELITFRPMMHNFQSTKKPLKKLSSKKNRILTFEHSIMHSPKIAKEIANEFSTTTFTVMQRTKSASRSILNGMTL
ncbi:hypothetical protein DICVIV_07863 [Dictyocaulus viviparus]|uniref:Uncharacterized protein n=1 Tax=Dictyocaulus viviparus TaxID=29172 RepID=A0A0D8XN60_DICVI|nr:hypothetical protein DICVIV_07863 [Dictyocaulus viviparus]